MGDITLKQLLKQTYAYVENRYEYRKRDVVKRIIIKKVQEINRHDIPKNPRTYTKYIIESKSYPQYPPYYTGKDSRGRSIQYQRTHSHFYDIVLEIDRLSLNTFNWKGRIGSGRVWVKSPSQNKIKTIYPKNRKRWSKERIEKHKKKAPYLDVGDYNSQVKGINGDFIFRCAYAWHFHDHLWGRNYYGNVPARKMNPLNIMFAPKHFINVVDLLARQGILKND